MTRRERQYHRGSKIKNKYGFDSFPLSKKRNPLSFIAEAPPCSNFGILIPTDMCRNPDGTPKEVKPEFRHPGDIITHTLQPQP